MNINALFIVKRSLRNYWFLLVLALIVITYGGVSCNESSANQNVHSRSIVVEATFSKYFYYSLYDVYNVRDKIGIRHTPFYEVSYEPSVETITERVINNKIKWVFNADKLTKVIPPMGEPVLMSPGDTLYVTYIGETPTYVGKNKIALSMVNELMKVHEQLIEPKKKSSYNAATLAEYKEWNQYLDKQLALKLPIIESYKDKVSAQEHEYYKSRAIGGIEHDRVRAFNGLMDSVHRGYPGLTDRDLLSIWDSTQYNPTRLWLKSLESYNGSIHDFYSFIRMEVCRKLNFDFSLDSLKAPHLFTTLVYNNVKENYHGEIRERLLAFILKEHAITELGAKNPLVQKMLKDYYNQPGFPEYKKWVKECEQEAAKRQLASN